MRDDEKRRLSLYREKATLNQSEVADYFSLLMIEKEEAEVVVATTPIPEVAEVKTVEVPKKKRSKR